MHSRETRVNTSWKTPKLLHLERWGLCLRKAKPHASEKCGKGLRGKGKWTYKLLNVLEFSSSRKLMPVIGKDEEGRILLLSKGVDKSVIKLFIAFNALKFLSEHSTY